MNEIDVFGHTEEILDSCGNDADELNKHGYQVYCMFCRGGVYNSVSNRNYTKPKSTLNFPNLYVRLYGCFSDKKYIDCAYKTIYDKYKDTLFDLTDPGCNSFVSLQNTLAQLYKKGNSFC